MTLFTGLSVPSDFPRAELDSLHEHLTARHGSAEKPFEWIEWVTAINGLVWRFLACDEHFSQAIASIRIEAMPAHPERYRQEKWLFAAIFEGYSAIECLYYANFFLGHHAAPTAFPISTLQTRITPAFVAKRFEAAFPSEALTVDLASARRDGEFIDWGTVRNILGHRSHPGRSTSTSDTRPTTWNLPGVNLLDVVTLQERRDWLGSTVQAIVSAGLSFAIANVP